MHRVRRPVALVSAILFQLMLVVGAYGCAATSGVPAVAVSMAGMSMPSSTGGEQAHSPADKGDGPCQLPSPAGCQAMAPCAPVAVTVAIAPDLQAERAPNAQLTLVLQAPASISRAPELPPPRA